MDELMVELVGLVLSHVDPLTLPACRAVCSRWNHALATTYLAAASDDESHEADPPTTP